MINNLSVFWLILIFAFSAGIIWIAGTTLTKTTYSLDTRFNLGDAMGGLILLGIAGSLPEIAVVTSAALAGHIPVIIGSLVGGMAIHPLIIVIFDFVIRGKRPLSYLAGTTLLFYESLLVLFIGVLVLFGTLMPFTSTIYHMNFFSIFIVAGYAGGLYMINKARKIKKLYESVPADADPGRPHHARRKIDHPYYAKKSNLYVIGVFLLASLATLVAGVFIERSGTAIAASFGISSGIFAATVMALASALPEISTGLESIFMGDNQLAISDIFGGSAFLPVLFIFADLLSNKPVLSLAENKDIIFIILGIAMTLVYSLAFLLKPKRRYFRFGADSILQIVIYALGIWSITLIK